MSEQLLDISAIRIDGDTQPRITIDQAIVQEYAEAIAAGAEFPAVEVVHDGTAHWLVDGFHRYFAHRRLNRTQIRAEVVAGDLSEARWISVAANKTNGLHRSNPDKAKAVNRALKLRPGLSDRAIAEHVGVDATMVGRYRHATTEAGAVKQHLPTRIGRDGKRYPARGRSRRGRATIAKNALKPVRVGTVPERMKALNLPYNPEIAANTLISVFDAEYLRALVSFLTKHLQGVRS